MLRTLKGAYEENVGATKLEDYIHSSVEPTIRKLSPGNEYLCFLIEGIGEKDASPCICI